VTTRTVRVLAAGRDVGGLLEEVMFGALLDSRPDQLKSSLRDHVARGRKLSGADVGRAEVLHTALFHRVRAFFTAYDLLLLRSARCWPSTSS
jgi:amidase